MRMSGHAHTHTYTLTILLQIWRLNKPTSENEEYDESIMLQG